VITKPTKPNKQNTKTSDTTMSSNINPETGESVNGGGGVNGGGRSSRFTLWVAFLVFASITMGSAVEVVRAVSCCVAALTKIKQEGTRRID
jgi:hypothetical protein